MQHFSVVSDFHSVFVGYNRNRTTSAIIDIFLPLAQTTQIWLNGNEMCLEVCGIHFNEGVTSADSQMDLVKRKAMAIGHLGRGIEQAFVDRDVCVFSTL